MRHIAGPTSQSELTGVQDGDIQPNAVDLRLDIVREFCRPYNEFNPFIISDDKKQHRATRDVYCDPESEVYVLENGTYQIEFSNSISVGDGEAGWVITRSTLLRNGVFIISGLYDSGYEGRMAALLVVSGGTACIKKGTRIGQYLSFNAETLHLYNGSYGVKNEAK